MALHGEGQVGAGHRLAVTPGGVVVDVDGVVEVVLGGDAVGQNVLKLGVLVQGHQWLRSR